MESFKDKKEKEKKGRRERKENILPWSHKDRKEDEWAYLRKRERKRSEGWLEEKMIRRRSDHGTRRAVIPLPANINLATGKILFTRRSAPSSSWNFLQDA